MKKKTFTIPDIILEVLAEQYGFNNQTVYNAFSRRTVPYLRIRQTILYIMNTEMDISVAEISQMLNMPGTSARARITKAIEEVEDRIDDDQTILSIINDVRKPIVHEKTKRNHIRAIKVLNKRYPIKPVTQCLNILELEARIQQLACFSNIYDPMKRK